MLILKICTFQSSSVPIFAGKGDCSENLSFCTCSYKKTIHFYSLQLNKLWNGKLKGRIYKINKTNTPLNCTILEALLPPSAQSQSWQFQREMWDVGIDTTFSVFFLPLVTHFRTPEQILGFLPSIFVSPMPSSEMYTNICDDSSLLILWEKFGVSLGTRLRL